MYRKCFFKSKGGLSRKFVASGLAAVFGSGMFGSYAGAMEPVQIPEYFLNKNDKEKLDNVLKNDSIEEGNENAKKVFKFFIKFYEHKQLPKQNSMWSLWYGSVKGGDNLLNNKYFLIRVYAYLLLYKFREFKDGGIKDFLAKWNSDTLEKYFDSVLKYLNGDNATKLLNKIKGGWGDKVLKEVKKEKLEEDKTKNKFLKTIVVVVPVVIILLALIKTLAVKGKS